MQRRSNDLLVQTVGSVVLAALATVGAIVTGSSGEPIVSGDALVGLYAAILGYVFGIGNGVRVGRAGEVARAAGRAEEAAKRAEARAADAAAEVEE